MKKNFSTEFKRESAQLVVDQNYTVADAAKATNVGLSTMTRGVKQLRDERQGKTPKVSPMTPKKSKITTMATRRGYQMGRWLTGRLMKELGLISGQQSTHRYKRGGHEHVVISNNLERQFAVTEPNHAW